MFQWIADRRRRKINAVPFPASWEEIVRKNVAHYCMLDDGERAKLRAFIQVFIAEKDWEGAGDLELTDEIRVTIAAQACLLLLGCPTTIIKTLKPLSSILQP